MLTKFKASLGQARISGISEFQGLSRNKSILTANLCIIVSIVTLEEAQKIFKQWQAYQEIGDKLHTIFNTVPESFLPYPAEILEEALNIVAKHYFDSGNRRAAKNIQEMMMLHMGGLYLSTNSKGKTTALNRPMGDKEALKEMKEQLDFIITNPDLLKAKLKNLEKSKDSWAKFKENL